MGEYGENPDPNEEKIERELTEEMYFQKIADKMIKEKGLEKVVQKRKRTVPNKTYKKFYYEANKLNSNFSEDWREKAELLMKYFPSKIKKEVTTFIHNEDYSKISSLYDKFINYSKKLINQ